MGVTPETGDPELDKRLNQWLQWDRNEKTRSDIVGMAESRNLTDLRRLLMTHLEFGTAGLRAEMGAGFNRMNDLTIIQSTQGLLRCLENYCQQLKSQGVVVGYDARYNSHRFAHLAASIFLHADVPVYLFNDINPTPYVAYGVLHYGCACGIMITASHNPKQDNGYKVYWSNGAQIASPIDEHISQAISENEAPWKTSWDTNIVNTSHICRAPDDEIATSYNKDLNQLCNYRSLNSSCPLRFTYTAMHGVGFKFVNKAMAEFGFPLPIPVKEQVEPDPEFPTVKYPNPEEGEGALLLSIKTAELHDSTVILANDPDADRLALAEKQTDGHWKVFSGNEIGALFGWWCWHCHKLRNPHIPASDVYMIASTVSSKILNSIAQKEGFHFVEVLTGFKWMGNKSDELQKDGKTVLFAFEEAIGFMCGTNVLDKDGVSASVVIAEMTAYLHSISTSIQQQLDNIYQKYGYHLSKNSYFICYDADTIAELFEKLRNYEDSGKYPQVCGQYKIRHVRDLTVGYDSSTCDGIPLLPVSSASQMITFTFDNGCVATLRTSGTEPKIKYYAEHCPEPDKGLDEAGAQTELEDMVACIIMYFLQPDRYHLIAQST